MSSFEAALLTVDFSFSLEWRGRGRFHFGFLFFSGGGANIAFVSQDDGCLKLLLSPFNRELHFVCVSCSNVYNLFCLWVEQEQEEQRRQNHPYRLDMNFASRMEKVLDMNVLAEIHEKLMDPEFQGFLPENEHSTLMSARPEDFQVLADRWSDVFHEGSSRAARVERGSSTTSMSRAEIQRLVAAGGAPYLSVDVYPCPTKPSTPF